MSFRAKIENIWYHYKSMLIVGLLFLFIVLFALYSCVTKKEYDVQVFYVSENPIYTEHLAWIESAVVAHCDDMDGDGEVNVSVTGVRVGKFADRDILSSYMTAAQSGEVMLFFGDTGGMEYLHERGYLQDLTSVLENPDPGSDYLWPVATTGLSSEIDGYLDCFGTEPLYLALFIEGGWVTNTPHGAENYKIASAVFKRLVSVEGEGALLPSDPSTDSDSSPSLGSSSGNPAVSDSQDTGTATDTTDG